MNVRSSRPPIASSTPPTSPPPSWPICPVFVSLPQRGSSMLPELTIGLELAQSFDLTALVALENRPGDNGTVYAARMIERWGHKPYQLIPDFARRAEEQLRRLLVDEHFKQHGRVIHL